MIPTTLKIAIVDDHRLIRRSLSMLVETFEDIKVAVQAENGSVLLEKLKSISVDLVLLDLEMPIMDGYQTSQILNKYYPDIKILVVSQFTGSANVHKALESGAHGYITKGSNPDLLELAIRSVCQNGFYFDPELGNTLHELIKGERKHTKVLNALTHVTDREMEIIRVSSKGFNTAEIAEKLCITVRTVETHRKRIIEKTDAKNFTGVILLALKHGYINVSDL